MSRPPLPPFAALRAFSVLGVAGGIRRAAVVLGVDHAIVSRHLSSLERRFNAQFLDRNTGKLTAIGAEYHRRVHAALLQLDEASDVFAKDSGRSLRVSCSAGFALHWLVHRLHEFSGGRNRPTVDLVVAGHDPGAVRDNVDADIRYVLDNMPSTPNHNLQMIDLASPTVFPVASPEFLRNLEQPILSVSSLLELPLIEEVDGTEWNTWFSAQSVVSSSRRRSAARYGQAQLTIAAARAGRGIALGNHYLVQDELKAGTLQIVKPVEQPCLPVQIGAYRFQAKRANWDQPELRAFRNWLKAGISADQPDL